MTQIGPLVLFKNRHENGHTDITFYSGVADSLRSSRLLESLSDDERALLLGEGRSVLFRQEDIVSEQGTAIVAALFIVDGGAKAEVSAPANAAFKAVVDFLGDSCPVEQDV